MKQFMLSFKASKKFIVPVIFSTFAACSSVSRNPLETPATDRVAKAQASIFKIFVAHGERARQGTAFLYKSGDLIWTAAHNVGDVLPGTELKIMLLGSDGEIYWQFDEPGSKAVVEFPGRDPFVWKGSPEVNAILGTVGPHIMDFATIRLSRSLPQPALQAAAKKAARGDAVFALGFPQESHEDFTTKPQIAAGTIVPFDVWEKTEASQKTKPMIMQAFEEKGPLLFHNAPMSGGFSGGPLVNSSGQLVGINTMGNIRPAESKDSIGHSAAIDAYHWIPMTLKKMENR